MCKHFREKGAPVVFVRVSFAADGADVLSQPSDEQMPRGARPDGWDVLSPTLGSGATRHPHHKAPMGCFLWNRVGSPTEAPRYHDSRDVRHLDQHRRRIDGARRWERGYAIVFAEDAMASFDARRTRVRREEHLRPARARAFDERGARRAGVTAPVPKSSSAAVRPIFASLAAPRPSAIH